VELTKRTKVAGGVLALALAFLIWDRLNAPASASAATEATPPAPSATAAAPSKGPAPKTADQALHQGALADRLEQLSAGSGSRADAFAAPMEWFPAPVVAPPSKARPEAAPVDFSKHCLSNVVVGGPGLPVIAVVDGHTIKVGQTWMSPEGDMSIEVVEASRAGGGRAKVRINGREGELKVQNTRKAEAAGGS
jgi:hypothetical protein